MNTQRVALITGANRGIGLEICRQLAQNKNITVILTSRDEKKGQAVISREQARLFRTEFRALDVTNVASITQCVDSIIKEHGRIDILINNAGIFPDTQDDGRERFETVPYRPSIFETNLTTMRRGMETNVYGPLLLCQKIVPLMKKNNYGRIVNMSSGMGQLSEMNGGYPSYRVSKTGLNALTRIFADELKGTNVLINSMCPGWVKTDMGGPNATRELPEGADTAVYLATLPDGGPSGGFFRDRKPIPW